MIVVASAFFDPGSSVPSVVAAIQEDSLAEGLSPEAAAEAQRLSAAAQGAFVASETIVVPEGTDLAGATLAAQSWAAGDPDRLANLAMLFYWNQAKLQETNPGGLLSGTIPVPRAGVADVERVLVALSRSPAYLGQRIVAISERPRPTPVAMRDGRTALLGASATTILSALRGPGVRPRLIDRLSALVDATLSQGG